jgi:hypothetical protein
VWRSVGVGALGLVGGVLMALVVQDLLAVAFISDGSVAPALIAVVAFLIPVCGALGTVVAVILDNRSRKRRGSDG